MVNKTEESSVIGARAVQWWIFLAAVYTLFIFLLPANKATMEAYHLTPIGYHSILFTASIPTLFIWFSAFIAYAALRKYAHAVRSGPEGKHFDQLARGATWLAWSLPVTSITSIILNTIANHWYGFHPVAIITVNYISLILPLIAFVYIGRATEDLLGTTKRALTMRNTRFITALFIVAGITYCYLTFKHLNLSSLSSTDNPYFLPGWLMILTVIIPYLYVWFIGILAAYRVLLYSKNVQGLLYRRALLYLASGITAVLVSSIALQYTNAVVPRVGHLVLDYRLILNVSFRVIGGIGFILLAIGANRLKKIEEV